MLSANEESSFPHLDTRVTSTQIRQQAVRESGPVGSVPMPGTVRAAVSSVLQKIKGHHPAILIDRLGERLAFERSSVRLYEALILKCSAAFPEMDLQILRQYREEELGHYFLLEDVLEKMGADPTAQTPFADSISVSTLGLIQVVNDPRMTVAQCVEALLMAELADNDAWDLLINMVQEVGMAEEVHQFQNAKIQEDRHLKFLRRWLEEMTLERHS